MPLNDLRARLRIRTRAHDLATAARERRTAARYAGWRDDPIVPGTVLYESFFGNGMLDNPEAIFRYLLAAPDQQHLTHVWVLDDVAAHPRTTAEFAEDSRVGFVGIDTPDYLKALATSQYLVNNATFPQQFAKRAGQTYLNTWHGVPLKQMGYDMPDGGIESRNITRNFLQADYLVSANPFMTEVMYRRGYRLQGIFRGAVVEEGQPRIDRQVAAAEDREATLAGLEARGLPVTGRQVVLFAPTWRGDSFNDPHVNAAELVGTTAALQQALGSDYVVLLKTHQVVHDAVRSRLGRDKGMAKANSLVPNDIATNVLLGVCDLLVTDYSSIFFDFLATGRPIVHYVPDLEDYRDSRGLYLPQEQLFGPFCQAVPELADRVREALEGGGPAGDGTSERSRAGAAKFNAKDDGNATERLVDLVFRGAEESGYTVHRDFGTEKERLCIYLGSMMSNGINTSALNLLRNLDYDRYDVTAFWAFSKGRDRARNASFVDPRARVVPRATIFNGRPDRVRRVQRQMLDKGLPKKLSRAHLQFWGEEYQRTFGEAEFDHLIDFSGYGCYSPFLFTAAKGNPTRSIWLHNDMAADQQRETIGEKHLEARLGAVFSTYRYFDHLVSVSPELMRINRDSLADYAAPEKFRFALNSIDGDRVLRMAGRPVQEPGEEAARLAPSGESGAAVATFDPTNVASAVASLMAHFKAGDIIREARSRQRINTLDVSGTVTTFVTVGRLSPEKNHRRLIEAFAQVHSRHPGVRLVILGGGKLEVALAEQISNLGMEPFISLAGQVDNPFAILAEADCFVLSSDYEGQPMVILEARAVGLPVITTSFSSVGDSVPEDAGIVVPKSVAGVAAGLERFLTGDVPTHPLDYKQYNAIASAQFDKAIGARSCVRRA